LNLPEPAVAHETRNVVYDIVRENSQRGVARFDEKQKTKSIPPRHRAQRNRVKLSS